MKRNLGGLVKRGMAQAAERRNHPIEKIMLASAGFARQPSDPQVEEMATAVTGALAPLLGIAMSGNVHAIRKVTELASTLCGETTTLACMHQEAADTVARERATWPLNISHDASERRRALRLVSGPRKLPLGNKDRVRPGARKAYGYSSPANAAVLVAIKAIEIERSFRVPSELFPVLQPEWSAAAARLPGLDAGAADSWFDVIWMYICQRHAGAPEQSTLRRLAETEGSIAGASEVAVRTAIRRALRAAFDRMLRQRKR